MSARRRVAVVGSGVSGLVAAHVLSRTDSVVLYEADDRLGGHAHTQDVEVDGRTVPVDTGFIVHNDRTYPTLLRLFDELGVEAQQSDMSMSVRADSDGIEYAGGQGASGIVPSARMLARPRYLRMLAEIPRFHAAARELLDAPEDGGTGPSLGEFVAAQGFSADLRRWFLTPLVAAVWSCDPADAEAYPARSLFTFLSHHGMLGVLGSPAWRTVSGGSRTYVERVAARLDEVHLSSPVASVREGEDGVTITLADGRTDHVDAVVVATHAPAALSLLAEPTDAQREVLGAIPYSRNLAQLHTDESVLPRTPRARASWNYLVPDSERPGEVVVTYDLTRLQRLRTGDTRLLCTLGGADLVDPDKVIATMDYEHPLYTAASVDAQQRLGTIGTDRVVFAGAYHGWGFHEDGALSGLRAAERLGATWDETPRTEPAPAHPVLPLIYRTTVEHSRRSPLRHRFSTRSYSWLVDLDHLPDHGALARFEARDHIGDPERSIRENLDHLLAEHGIDLDGGQVLMLTSARVLGYVFNPITVYWCYRADRELACVVVEVHNTYGDRHAYVVHPDERGDATVDKELYVSPFNDVSGTYRLHVPEPGDEVHVAVRLDRDDEAPFVATMRGRGTPATLATVRRIARRQPAEPLAVAARIRQQGIALWARRLPVQQRPEHPAQPGVLGRGGVDPVRWPDVATVPTGPRAAVAARVTTGLIRSVARSLDVRVALPDGTVLGGKAGRTDLPLLQVRRLDDLARRVGTHGLIGFGEAYMAGDWEADDLTAVLTAFAERVEDIVPASWQRLRAAYVARHPSTEVNSVENTQSNISRHYDLSNDLFASFLDPSMAYSSALFTTPDPGEAELADAQAAKFDRLLDEARVGPGTQLLEIGTGWGELALRAARRGAHVTTVTLSTEQADLATRRVAEAGLSDQVEILVRDYRLVEGTYDAVVSVEMIEAVGLDYLGEYFATIERVLRPGGRAAIQAITMPDHRMLATRDTYTWVHKYIFPGGLIPSLEAMDRAMAPSGLRVAEDLAMGPSYAQTLRMWDDRFERAWPSLDLGLDETFRRMWHFYLCYSRAGFEASYLDVHQLSIERVDQRVSTDDLQEASA
ncbi:DUF1365 family protein [Janibacter melonis]|uniref:DUF1365 family protein n=1 Tax=Janibacter melonis TaxID=262209 RepID=UPI0027DEF530|nr:DUF1365 family protein [Janibacter melonis]